ncbi:MAG: porin [Piscinibacter sp.]
MKPQHLIPLSLAAMAGAAHAQSSVTLYTLLDVNVSHYSAGSQSGAGSVWKMQDGTVNGLNGSRWGIRTSEDLGGGLRANVLAEAGLLADTGSAAQGGRAFGRQVYVALSQAGVGEVRLGRQYILEDSVMALTNPFANALVSNPSTSVNNAGRNLPLWLNAPRADNVVQLQTASLGGFMLAAQVAPGEGTADRFQGVRLAYAGGPLNAALSYEMNKSRSTGDTTNKSLTIGANYDFGVLKLMGGLQRNSDLATGSGNGAAVGVSNLVVTGASSLTMTDLNGYTIGAEIPVGTATVLGVNYTGVKYESATGQSLTLGKAALTARYGLSKNTFLYTGVSMATGDLKNYIAEKTVVQAGMRAAF